MSLRQTASAMEAAQWAAGTEVVVENEKRSNKKRAGKEERGEEEEEEKKEGR